MSHSNNVLIKFIKFVKILIRYKKYSISFIWHLLQLHKLETIRMVAFALKYTFNIYILCVYVYILPKIIYFSKIISFFVRSSEQIYITTSKKSRYY